MIKVDARQYPVTTHFAKTTPDDHVAAAFKKICSIHAKLPAGGILVFLTGVREIQHLCQKLRQRCRKQRKGGAEPEPEPESAAAGGEEGADEGADEGAWAELSEEEVAKLRVERDERRRQKAEARAAAAAVARVEAEGGAASRHHPSRAEGLLMGEEQEEREASRARKVGQAQGGEGGKAWYDQGAAEEEGDWGEDDDEGNEDGELGEDAAAAAGPILVLPLYAMLPAHKQMQVFEPPPEGTRLIVVATNVAETSITIPNIRYVVDSGKLKQRKYEEGYAVSKFELEWTSQASADQRAGRAGRVGPGHCYRLYSSSVFTNVLPQFAESEISRVPVEGVVLALKAMGIARVANFPFPEPPPRHALEAAHTSLRSLGALDGSAEARATPLGFLLSRLPIAARLGKLLLVTRQMGLLRYGLPLVCMLAQPDPTARGDEAEGEGEEAEEREDAPTAANAGGGGGGVGGGGAGERWRCPESEAVDLLGMFLAWRARGADEAAAAACGLSAKVMREVSQLHSQLAELLAAVFPGETPPPPPDVPPTAHQATGLRRALCCALPDCVVRLASLGSSPAEQQLVAELGADLRPALLRKAFVGAQNAARQLLWLRPNSALAKLRPRPAYVCFFEVIQGAKRPYLARATLIEPGWLPEAAPSLTTLSPPLREMPPRYDRAADAALCWQQPTYGAAQWVLPPVPRPPPAADAELCAALFLRALCDGQVFKALHPLASHLEPRLRSLGTVAGGTERAALAARALLVTRRVCTGAALAAAWQEEPRFLLRELGALLPAEPRRALLELWPSMLVQAERAFRAK